METRSAVYGQLLQETARIEWAELERFFARGVLLGVAGHLDLVAVAEAIARDDTARVEAWLRDGLLERMSEPRAQDYAVRRPTLWATVVSPWVLVQERTGTLN